jgi:7-cyano-7-deazaguanine synthase
MDSATLAWQLHDQGFHGAGLRLLSFDYGQRHRRELDAAQQLAGRLGAAHQLIDLHRLGGLLTGSALTDPAVAVPDGHYAAPSMRATVVPNRNAILLSVAYGIASAADAELVAAGMHAGDHPIYPDCRPAFMDHFYAMELVALDGLPTPRLHTPFLHHTKADIAAVGDRLGVPWELTWSCYKGGPVHCGVCGTCTERREAFQLAGVHDPTRYATTSPLPS